jgi:hypothetical protein
MISTLSLTKILASEKKPVNHTRTSEMHNTRLDETGKRQTTKLFPTAVGRAKTKTWK